MLALGCFWRVGGLAGLLFPVVVEARGQPQDASIVQVSVELADATGLSLDVMSRLRTEVEQIYMRAGVRIEWLSEGPVAVPPHMARVYILEELPALLETRVRSFRGKKPLATVFGRGTNVSGPVIYISRTAVSRSANDGAAGALSPDAIARAMGRVVAHELAHRFISTEHTSGILKADFLPSELTAPTSGLDFTAEHNRRLRQVARPWSGGPNEATARIDRKVRRPNPPNRWSPDSADSR